MRAFETTSLWDTEKKKWYEEYFIDGKQVSADDYFEEMEFETFEGNECDGDCEKCSEYEEENSCDCLDCTVERYKDMILNTNGCPCCVEDILKDFVCTIAEKLGVFDNEE